MRNKGPDNQIHFVGGVLLGAVLFGFLAAVGKRDLVDLLARWQELVGAVFASAVTLFGARMIVEQIRADDDREARKAHLEARRAATAIKAEIEAILDVLARRQSRYGSLIEISKKIGWDDASKGMYPMLQLTDIQANIVSRVTRKPLDVPDLDRLNQRLELIGVVGDRTGSIVIIFYNAAKALPDRGSYSCFGATESRSEVYWVGIQGELALAALNHVIEHGTAEEQLQAKDIVGERFKHATDTWDTRVSTATRVRELMADK